MENKIKPQKQLISKHLKSLQRFNEWEKCCLDKMDGDQSLAAVFALYDLIPENARQRDVNVEGIMKMRRDLACLK